MTGTTYRPAKTPSSHISRTDISLMMNWLRFTKFAIAETKIDEPRILVSGEVADKFGKPGSSEGRMSLGMRKREGRSRRKAALTSSLHRN